jgi:hypothetical protein
MGRSEARRAFRQKLPNSSKDGLFQPLLAREARP